MKAVKLMVNVQNHRISADVPASVPDGEAEVVILYEAQDADAVEQSGRRHLEALLARVRRHSPNRTREDIDRQVAEERSSWGE